MILFRCSTFYHVINVINIKINLLPKEEAILLLNSDSDFKPLIEKIQNCRLFSKIIHSPLRTPDMNEYWFGNTEERKSILENPLEYLNKLEGYDIFHKYDLKDVTDIYFGMDYPYISLLYYAMVGKGVIPELHVYDEGSASYALEIKPWLEKSGFQHDFYGSNSILNHFKEILLYEPALCVVNQNLCEINAIPKIEGKNSALKKIYNSIWEIPKIPDEKYIFFEGGRAADGLPSNERDIVESIAKVVGKKNLVIKRYPRSKNNVYEKMGYKMIVESKVPFELTWLNYNLEDKILISDVSTGSLSGVYIFNKNATLIHINKLINIGTNLFTTQRLFPLCYEQIKKKFAAVGTNVYCPEDLNELRKVVTYLDAKEDAEEKYVVLSQKKEIPDADKKNTIPIVISASNACISFSAAAIVSMLENSNKNFQYDIIMLADNPSEKVRAAFKLLEQDFENCSINIVKMWEFREIAGLVWEKIIRPGGSREEWFKVFLPYILPNYDRVIHIDVDTIVCGDISELYDVKLGGNEMIAATKDIAHIALYNFSKDVLGDDKYGVFNQFAPFFNDYFDDLRNDKLYMDYELGIINPYAVFQTGVLVMDLDKIRQKYSFKHLKSIVLKKKRKYGDYDVMNELYHNYYKELDYSWNIVGDAKRTADVFLAFAPCDEYQKYKNSYENRKIIHYQGKIKPWRSLVMSNNYIFWQYMKKTVFYEMFINLYTEQMIKEFIQQKQKNK